MARLKTTLAVIAAAILALGALPATAQQFREIGRFTGPWTTPGNVRVTFPDIVGDFRLGSITIFGAKDGGAVYELDRDGRRVNTVTVYFYARRRGETCQEEFRGAETAIEQKSPGMTRLSEGVADSPRGGAPGSAMHALYALATGEDGTPTIASSLYLYCHPESKWWIKARSTWPAELDRDGDVATILRAISWPAAVAD